jgi:hypothetical protein
MLVDAHNIDLEQQIVSDFDRCRFLCHTTILAFAEIASRARMNTGSSTGSRRSGALLRFRGELIGATSTIPDIRKW